MNYVLDSSDLREAARFWSAASGVLTTEVEYSPGLI